MAQLFDHLLEKLNTIPKDQWHKTAIIFPGRRAGVIFRKKIALQLQKPAFSPAILSLTDLVSRETKMRLIDPIQLQFELYEAFLEFDPDETFESFLKWGPAVLRDFAEVDGYLLDADQVFGYLSREKAIDLWNPGATELGPSAQAYLLFFSQLGNLYHQLKAKIESKSVGWATQLTRQLAEAVTQGSHPHQFEHYLFAGFNALNAAETSLIKSLMAQGKAQVLFEADAFYMQGAHEAGHFMRKLAADPAFNDCLLLNGRLQQGDTEIRVIETTGQAAQIQLAAEQLEHWHTAGIPPEDCVLVLADERMLIPLLSALPACFESPNITLGYPFEDGHAYALLMAHIQLLSQSPEKNGQSQYYQYDLLRFLQNPLFNHPNSNQAVQKLRASGQIKFEAAQLQTLLREHAQLDVDWWTMGKATPAQWMPLWQVLFSQLANSTQIDDLQQGMCLQMLTLLRRLSGKLHQFPTLNHWPLFQQLIQQLAKNEQVAFLGEPYAGLQIMGVLETRALHFKRVMVLGLNEGMLPALSRQDGYITLSLRQAFQLPGPREKEAVFAYHFYRLLQHADQSWLLCNGNTDDFGQGEPSRYIQQLAFEWPGVQKGNFHYEYLKTPALSGIPITPPIVIEKTDERFELIKEKLALSISPSALIQLISCELKFYFSRILGLRAQADLQEDVEARELGDLLHKTLELLYQPYLNQKLHPQDVQAMEQRVVETLEQVIKTHFNDRQFDNGLNLLVYQIAINYLTRFLANEKETCKQHHLEILGLEAPLSATLQGPAGNFQIKGIADRIDRLDGELRIIDYKTGDFKPSEVKIETVETDLLDPKKGKAFQLLAYAWMYKQAHPQLGHIASAILSFRKMKDVGQLITPETLDDQQLFQAFETQVGQLFERFLQRDLPIVQTTDLEQCKKCDFNQICHRI
jgi:ATP-dependent helicase/nuclease subunit B